MVRKQSKNRNVQEETKVEVKPESPTKSQSCFYPKNAKHLTKFVAVAFPWEASSSALFILRSDCASSIVLKSVSTCNTLNFIYIPAG